MRTRRLLNRFQTMVCSPNNVIVAQLVTLRQRREATPDQWCIFNHALHRAQTAISSTAAETSNNTAQKLRSWYQTVKHLFRWMWWIKTNLAGACSSESIAHHACLKLADNVDILHTFCDQTDPSALCILFYSDCLTSCGVIQHQQNMWPNLLL